jgi:hypothetical protein
MAKSSTSSGSGAAGRVSGDPLPAANQAGTQPMPSSDHEAAPSSGSTGRSDPQSPTRAGAGAAGAPATGTRAPGALPVTEAGDVSPA